MTTVHFRRARRLGFLVEWCPVQRRRFDPLVAIKLLESVEYALFVASRSYEGAIAN